MTNAGYLLQWGPVIDGAFLRTPLSEATATSPGNGGGGLQIEYGFGMYNTHEGEGFTPAELSNIAATNETMAISFDAWLEGYLPGLTDDDLARLREAYPAVGSAELIDRYEDPRTRAGLVYRDSVLACPAYWMAGAATKGSWLGEYTMPPAAHASDVYWVSRFLFRVVVVFYDEYHLLTTYVMFDVSGIQSTAISRRIVFTTRDTQVSTYLHPVRLGCLCYPFKWIDG